MSTICEWYATQLVPSSFNLGIVTVLRNDVLVLILSEWIVSLGPHARAHNLIKNDAQLRVGYANSISNNYLIKNDAIQ